MIRIAAVGDLHYGRSSAGSFRPHVDQLAEHADLLLLAGDLTRVGDPSEAACLADDLVDAPVPVIGVLGNHDHHSGQQDEVRLVLEKAGVTVLEGSSAVVDVGSVTVGVAGVNGFGGGYAGACATAFGEPQMKAFVRHTQTVADALAGALSALDTDVRVALTHYSPTETTLIGERLEIYPFLGSYLLAKAIDDAGADLAVHGHAHNGTEKGMTPGGTQVRNVALPVLHAAYAVYCLEPAMRVG
jgi:Icc-related predicted phosphoesterase